MTAGAKQTGSVTVDSGHQDVVHDVAMDYYGKRMASCSSDRSIKIFSVSPSGSDPPAALATLTGHEGPVWQVAWAHPKFGSLLASCSYDRKVIVWKEGPDNEWSQWQLFQEHNSSVNSISWAPHEFGLSLACASSDGTISVLTHKPDGQWERTKIEQAHPVGVTSVSWAPSTAPGSLAGGGSAAPVVKLASGGCDSTVKVWRYSDGSWRLDCFPPLSKHTDWVRDVAWAPNLGLPKSTIASASQDGTVLIWSQDKEGDQWEGRVLHNFHTPVWRVHWSLTGNLLAVADGNNEVTLWKEVVDGEWTQGGKGLTDSERLHTSAFARPGSSSGRAVISSSRQSVPSEAIDPSPSLTNKMVPISLRTSGMQGTSPVASADPKRTVSNRHPLNMGNYEAALKEVECLSFELEHR